MTFPEITPLRIDLKRDERLVVEWGDGRVCIYPISLLRSMCPCALCKTVRGESSVPASSSSPATAPAVPAVGGGGRRKTSLSLLPGNYATPLRAESAELVGNYALRIEWSDKHGSGIYSFQYLRQICPPDRPAPAGAT